MQKYVLIAAGGKGGRMASSLPKQFMMLAGRPVLMHVFDVFMKYDPNIRVVVALPDALHGRWADLCRQHHLFAQHEVVSGGPTRYHSVKNALKHIPEGVLVAVHDGARPLVPLELIARVFTIAERFGNAIPVVEVNDSVRLVDHAMSSPADRNRVRLVQTPQCFRSSLLKKAYQQTYRESFTDDACVLESQGERLYLVDGKPENIKITTPLEAKIAETLIG